VEQEPRGGLAAGLQQQAQGLFGVEQVQRHGDEVRLLPAAGRQDVGAAGGSGR
jgi:hypothetical protein